MPRALSRLSLSAALCLGAAAPALADAASLWQRWQAEGIAPGVAITAETAQPVAGGLDLTGVRVRTLDPGGAQITAEMQTLALRDAEGGRVTLRLPPQTPILVDPADGPAQPLLLEGPEITGSLDSDDPTGPLRLAVPEATLSALPQSGSDETVPPVVLTLTGVAGEASVTGPQAAMLDASAETITWEVSEQDIPDGPRFAVRVQNRDLAISALSTATTTEASADGASGAAVLTLAEDGSTTRIQVEHGAFASFSGSAAGRGTVSNEVEAVRATIDAPQLPIRDIALSLDTARLKFAGPIVPPDALDSAEIEMALSGLVLDDRVWDLIDPQGTLDRSPGRLDLSVTGETAAGQLPGQATPQILPRSVSVESLLLSLAGATIGAQGAFAFPQGPGGIPDIINPEGQAEIRAEGVLGLISALSQAGIVTPEQMFGFQMMLGMFAEQGEGDTLTSRIVAGPDGAISVNGNRLR